MTDPLRRLAHRVNQLEAQVRGFSNSPQLAYSSLEDGALQEYDGAGNLVSIIGKQHDGTHGAVVVSGPVPPTPTAPVLTGGMGLTGGWDGVFVDDAGQPDITIPSPMDWARAELHISQTKGFSADTADTLAGTLETPRGGSMSMLVEPGTWYAVLVARAASGKRSVQSAESVAVVEPPVGSDIDVDALRKEFQDAQDELQQDLIENAAAQAALGLEVSDLRDTTLPALGDELALAKDRLDDADQLLNVTFPKRITDAETKATTAASRAAAAETAAAKAAADLVTAKASAATAASNAAAAAAEADAAEASAARATGAAGVAEAAADEARQDAAAALAQAQNAGGDVGAAQAAATAAQAAADTAKAQASAAGTSAAAADAKAAQAAADAAKASADTALAQAAATKSAADAATAKTQATTSATKATAAETAAATAKTRADTAAADAAAAKTRADTAAAAAATAAAEADAAEASATRATGAAGVAETAADEAARDAAAALVQAQNAGGNVSTAQAAAAAAQTAANTAKTQATAAGTSAAAADAKAAQAAADAAKATADAVKAQASAATAATEAAAAKTQATASATKATAAETAAAAAKTRADTAAADATAAATRAAAAEASATKATGAAGTAETAADKARQDAAAALTQAQNSGSNATAAQTAANNAKTASDAAATAATTAGTRAAAADASAAAAAAKAAQAAADLITARNAAADARGDADTALARADSALTMAGSAARVLYSTGNPSGTAREGDTWRKIASDVGDVLGEWRYTKNSAGVLAWRAQKVTSDMVSNLDVGKLIAGTANLQTAVVTKLVANLAAFVKADIGNLTVTGTSSLNTLTAQRIAANVASFLSITTDQLVAGTATLGEAVAKKFAAETGAFMKLTANQVFIGEAGNLERDPNFDQLDGWRPENLDPVIYRDGDGGYNGKASMYFGAPLNAAAISGAWRYVQDGRFSFPVNPGEKYRISCWVKSDRALPVQSVVMYMRASTPDGGFWGVPVAESAQNAVPLVANTWHKITETVTIPANATSAFLGYFRFSKAAAAKIDFSLPTVQQAITPSLIVDGFFQGLRVIGASVETNELAETGVKLNDKGMTAYGKSAVRFGAVTKDYKVRANVDSRMNQWGDNATASVPGFWLESEPADGSTLAPQFPAGITLTNNDARALRARSAMAAITDPSSELVVAPTETRLETYAAGVAGQPRAAVSGLTVTPDKFTLGSVNAGLQPQAQVKHGGDGVLHLNAKNGVRVNGVEVGGSGNSPLLIASLMVTDQATVPDNDVAVKFNTTTGDHAMWGGTQQPTRLYARTAGLYFLSGNVIFSNQGGGMRGVWFRINGEQRLRGQSNPPPSAMQYAEIDAHNYINLKAGDYVEIMATVAGAAGAVWVMASQGTAGALEFKRPA